MKTALLLRRLYTGILILVLSAGLTSCSSQETSKTGKAAGEKSLSFYEYSGGEKIHYEVNFDRNNEIVSLHRNGKEIPEAEYDSYKDVIYDNLEDISRDSREYDHQYYYRFYPKEDSLSLSDYYLQSIPPKAHVHKYWSDSTFKKEMRKMKEEMAKLKDFKFRADFDRDKFNIEIEKMKKEIDLNLNEHLKDLNKEIRRMTEELREKEFHLEEIEVDIPDIHLEIEGLDRKISNLDKEMLELKKELKKIDAFMEDVREELVKDGIIESKDEDFSMTLKSGSMKINDKEIPAGKLQKYKDLYKKHFGKELKDSHRFEFN